MRVVHVVCTDAFAGVERYVADVSRAQAAEGHAVTVLGGSPSEMPRVFLDSRVRWRPAPTAMRAWRELARLRADVVHAHLTAAEVAAVTTRPLHRAAVVATLHLAQPRGRGPVRRRLYRVIPNFVDCQIAISQFVADRAAQPSEVILNGVPHDESGLETERAPIVLVAQRQEREKDTGTALRAWALSGLGDDGWTLEVAGTGSQAGSLRALADSLGITGSVVFTGFATDVRTRMAQSSIFLATAPDEPFGLSVVEAMAAGTAVVAAAGGGHLETVGSVSTDYLFTPRLAESCATALRKIATSPEARTTYGSALREAWLDRFTIEAHSRQLLKAYRRATSY